MDNSRTDVAIVSSFGTGHWLAVELRRLGLDVCLIDFSESLGRWTPEDIEGPFGLFNSEGLTQTMLARLDEEDYSENLEDGFCVWLPEGPMDVRGAHSNYLMEKRGVSLDEQRYLTRAETLGEKEKSVFRKKIRLSTFREYWLTHLAHSLAAPVYHPCSEAGLHGEPLPLMAPYGVRRVTRKGAERHYEWLQSHGVRVMRNAQLNDIVTDGSRVANLEIESEWSGVIGADRFLWMLSSTESAVVAPRFLELLFPRGILTPEWVWVRYRLDLGNPKLQETIPVQFISIGDLDLYWTHANMIAAQKSVTGENFDAWIRIPYSHRFHKEYLQEMGQNIVSHFAARVPASEPKIIDLPQEFHYDEATLGPSRHGVFNDNAHKKFSTRRFKNMTFDGPENHELLGWTGKFRAHARILRELEAWKTERDEIRAREARRDAQREASP